MFHIWSIYLSGSHDLDIHKDPSEVLWSDRHVIVELKSFPSFCTLSSLFFLLRRPPLTPPNRLPLPSSLPSQLVHPAQVWLRKKCVSLPREPAQCVISSLCQAVRRSVCVFSCTFVIFWMMSCFLIPLPLFFCAPRPALLLLSVLLSTNPTRFCVFCLFFPCICVSLLSLVSKQGSRAFGNSSSFFLFFPSFFLCFWLFYSNCLCWQFVFFGLSVFLEFKIGRQVCWHIFPGRHWVSRFTSEPFTMKDRGIKTAASLQTTASQMWMFLSIGDLGPVHPNLHTVLNAPLLLFMAPCSFLPLMDILSIASDPNILFIHLILPPPQNQRSTLPSPVFQSSVSFRLNLQTHRAVRYTGRTLTHCTSEPRP